MKKSLVIIGLFILGLLTIATCAGVWNYCPEPFVKWCAGFLFAAVGVFIFFVARRISADNKALKE